jgi:TolA-binding protein
MLQAIGSPSTGGLLRSVGRSAGQSSELAKLEKELSACVNCESAKTREGQAKIEALTQKISQVQQRVNEVEAQKDTRQAVVSTQPEANVAPALAGPQENELYRSNQASPFGHDVAPVGYRINTQA